MQLSLKIVEGYGLCKRAELFFDEELLFTVDLRLFKRHPILQENFTSKQQVLEHFYNAEYQVGFAYAIKALSRRGLHSNELKNKLAERLLSTKTAERIITYFQQHKWLKDEEYVACYVEGRAKKGKSAIEISQALAQRGVEVQLPKGHNVRALKTLIQKKYPQLSEESLERQEKDKLFARLFRKGFTFSDIREALASMKFED